MVPFPPGRPLHAGEPCASNPTPDPPEPPRDRHHTNVKPKCRFECYWNYSIDVEIVHFHVTDLIGDLMNFVQVKPSKLLRM